MKRVALAFCLTLVAPAVAANRSDQAPYVNYIFMAPGTPMPDLTDPLTTIARGGLAGAEGGFGLLVKGLILAIPTAIGLALSKVYSALRTNSSHEPELTRQEHVDAAYTRYYLAKTKHLLALMDYHKTHAQWQAMQPTLQASQQVMLEKIWQASTAQQTALSTPDQNTS